MPERRVRVAAPQGLHARPAARFVRAVRDSGLPVRVARADGAGTGPVNAASILGVLGLGVRRGEEVVLSCEGAGAAGTGAESAERLLGELADLLSVDRPERPGEAEL
ncbi:HPr family phosphocarrier protein [Streptomyces fragilis]|uniref:Phosphocarrier protein HPr n=1 Tax=Streptomyces fragilis TaxID=67301 RepID=A0ABV2YI66_9ACTN|nr:HPr family phosphocarrier protein [Streptomyces fragilis]